MHIVYNLELVLGEEFCAISILLRNANYYAQKELTHVAVFKFRLCECVGSADEFSGYY